uniref:Inhibitor of apoptosis protein n=1 Tax=Chionoecetes opilio bacilliform virus TaxID=1825681 RepID=A0A1Q3DLK8_9VIRU|nr:baculoviral IAP repeat-containing protein [Chionoecetes opilio bacilliform virus]GAV93213.1 hypothetical protein SCV_093 [Chionoecetes opilio bacilliform virus]
MGTRFFLFNDLFIESRRLNTFIDWPITNQLAPSELAKNGFYHIRYKDAVACVFCNIVLCGWEYTDTPDGEHKRLSGDCKFISGEKVGNITIEVEKHLNAANITALGDPHYHHGINGHFSDQEKREETFKSRSKTTFPAYEMWPSYLEPKVMADAGFYYCGIGDSVRCFKCSVGLRNWERHHNPIMQHLKYSPDCPAVHKEQIINPYNYDEINGGDDTKPFAIGQPTQETINIIVDDFYRTSHLVEGVSDIGEDKIKDAIRKHLVGEGRMFRSQTEFQDAVLYEMESQYLK